MVKGFGTGQKSVKKRRKDYLNFLRKILWTIRDSKTELKAVYQLLEKNLDKLDNNLPFILRDWTTANLSALESEQAYDRASNVSKFSKIIQELPEIKPVRRSTYIEIAIVGYEFALRGCLKSS